MLVLWFYQRFHQNAVVADLGFCVMFGVLSVVYAAVLEGEPSRKALVGTMGAVYGLRLAWHIGAHRMYGRSEDARYQELRRKMGPWAQFGFFVYFQGQALALVIFSIPVVVLMVSPSPPFGVWEIVGVLIWLVAIIGEAVADFQLRAFRDNPENKGKTCRHGLWRYSRHPNYFFEGLVWCSYVIMAIGVPYGGLTLLGPALMITALLKVSGIPYAEAQALSTRGDEYREYQRTTSLFVPWFPKK
ncbi:MAG: membrane protein [Nitrospirales bacterium]|nr:MAG: membrane protein [Nitrospirales bacterium]